MKIALNSTEAVDVKPSEDGEGIELTAYKFGVKVGSRVAQPDQIGALIFALEQALEERQTRQALKQAPGLALDSGEFIPASKLTPGRSA